MMRHVMPSMTRTGKMSAWPCPKNKTLIESNNLLTKQKDLLKFQINDAESFHKKEIESLKETHQISCNDFVKLNGELTEQIKRDSAQARDFLNQSVLN